MVTARRKNKTATPNKAPTIIPAMAPPAKPRGGPGGAGDTTPLPLAVGLPLGKGMGSPGLGPTWVELSSGGVKNKRVKSGSQIKSLVCPGKPWKVKLALGNDSVFSGG